MRALLLTSLLLGSLAAPAFSQSKPSDTQTTGSVSSVPHHRVRLGGIMITAGYTHFGGGPYYGYPFGYYPGYFGPGYWPFWDVYLPMYYPGFYSPFYSLSPGANMGEIKLHAAPRDAEVLLDGAYAGTAEHLKSFWLKPGAYNLEVRAGNRAPFSRRIYVLSGKTLKIEAALRPLEAKP